MKLYNFKFTPNAVVIKHYPQPAVSGPSEWSLAEFCALTQADAVCKILGIDSMPTHTVSYPDGYKYGVWTWDIPQTASPEQQEALLKLSDTFDATALREAACALKGSSVFKIQENPPKELVR